MEGGSKVWIGEGEFGMEGNPLLPSMLAPKNLAASL